MSSGEDIHGCQTSNFKGVTSPIARMDIYGSTFLQNTPPKYELNNLSGILCCMQGTPDNSVKAFAEGSVDHGANVEKVMF